MPYLIDFHRRAEDEFVLVAELYRASLSMPAGFPGDAIFSHRVSRAAISTVEIPDGANPCSWQHFVGYDDSQLEAAVRWILAAIMGLSPELVSDLVDTLMLDLTVNELEFQAETTANPSS